MSGSVIHLPARPDEVVRVPSGAEISLRRPDFLLCKSKDDFLELRCALMEKIIDIELQIDLFRSGVGTDQGRTYEKDWLPRATAALKWTKLYRDECQQRQGLFVDRDKFARQDAADRRFVDAARTYLPDADFRAILELSRGNLT